MPAPTSNDELLKLIRKSGMVEEPRLDEYLRKLEEDKALPPEPRKLAGYMVRDGLLTYFQAEQFMLGKWRGFTIGKYKLLERIGFGGMGQVFLCEHQVMRRRVAIKVLPPAKAEEPAALGRFYREARASGLLDHPNIARTNDIDQDGNLHFMVMEYVDGASLLEIVKRFGAMDVLRACHYIYQAALGLSHAQEKGIIHRDVKPGNILVDRTGLVKILDMGLARFFGDEIDNLTLKYDDKSVLGTADYVAPEQTVNSHTVDTRADIYGLGATFYFLLAGHPMFPEGTVAQKLVYHQSKQPTPIRNLRPEVSEAIAAILDRMIEKDKEKRFQTPAEVAEALLPFVQTPIPPPSEEEMPKLSPAALESAPAPIVKTPAPMQAATADSTFVRPEMLQRPARPLSVPVMENPTSTSLSATSNSSSATLESSATSSGSLPNSGIPEPAGSAEIRKQFTDPPPLKPALSMPPGTLRAVHSPIGETKAHPSPTEVTPAVASRPTTVPPFLMEPLPKPRAAGTSIVSIVLFVLFAGLIGTAVGVVAWLQLKPPAADVTK